uniref:Uncharacterized protein n=1 Tax=Arundo donax TaxID=35708 RepID=A0A0A8XU22_ARUDO
MHHLAVCMLNHMHGVCVCAKEMYNHQDLM